MCLGHLHFCFSWPFRLSLWRHLPSPMAINVFLHRGIIFRWWTCCYFASFVFARGGTSSSLTDYVFLLRFITNAWSYAPYVDSLVSRSSSYRPANGHCAIVFHSGDAVRSFYSLPQQVQKRQKSRRIARVLVPDGRGVKA